MTNLLVILLSTHVHAASDSAKMSTKATASAVKTIKTVPTAELSWTVGPQDCPQDEVYSTSDVYGTVGETDYQSMFTPITTGSATAYSEVEDEGETEHFTWEKRAENSQTSSWRITDRGARGVTWSYVGTSGHETETFLDAPGCEPDDFDIGCMVDVSSLSMSGLRTSSDGGEPGSTGGMGGSGMGGGTDSSDEDPHGPAYLNVEERTAFRLVVTFSARVGIDTSGIGTARHTSSFDMTVTNHDTGSVVLDEDTRPLDFGWPFQTDESGNLRESDGAVFVLDPGQYVFDMSVTDDSYAMSVSNPGEPESSADISSEVRATVLLVPL